VLFKDMSLDKFKQHATSHPWIGTKQSYVQHPVCPRCEKIALRDKGWAANRMCRCPACGWSGQSQLLLKEYINNKSYRS
jgi:predicted RNA-binding Zn-ribbon protein involved in translation (DUF1610 family)